MKSAKGVRVMPMVPFFSRFLDLARAETREAVVAEGPGLPGGRYGFLELYCDERDCDCRRVIIQVMSPGPKLKIWATINYGWEPAAYYQKWLGDDEEEGRFHAGAYLDPLGPQGEYAPELLDLFERIVLEPTYINRLKRHYRLFKEAVHADSVSSRSKKARNRVQGRRR